MKLPDSFSWVDVSDETFSNTLNDLLETDKNLNIIGPAGTGKSLLIKIASICLNKQVAICSTTGISAVNLTSDNIKATTLHSFFHLKPITVFNDEMIQVDHTLYNIMKRIDVLIIDEVSMLSSHMFDVIFKLLVMYRGAISKLPRIILFSDILQLPPVVNKQDPIINNFFEEEYDGNIMFFNSRFFQSMEFKTIHLTKLFRQKDSLFQNILNRIRLSEQTEEDLKIINEYVMPIEKYNSKNELYMYIATTNKVVENINENYFTFFKGEPRIYEGRKFGDFDMTKILPQDRIVKIKPNMQIMCTKNNYDDNYRNGSLGKVISCDPVSVKVILKNGLQTTVRRGDIIQYEYKLIDGKVEAIETGKYNQIELRTSKAITTHKSQGQTLDAIYFNPGGFVFTDSLVYVGLSRLTKIESLGLSRKIKMKDISTNIESLKFLEAI